MLTITNLRCQQREKPLGIDTPNPQFSWQLQSDLRHTVQKAYQIQVAVDPSFRKRLWETVSIPTEQSQYIGYEGPALESYQTYYWRVIVWDNHGRHTPWSEPESFETAMLSDDLWQAQWISLPQPTTESYQPAPFLRREFASQSPIKRARIYATAFGVYQLYLNGQAVGDHVLAPGWTSYHHRLQYQTYDVTNLVQDGDNALGAMLGDGWYRGFIGFKGQKAFYGNRLALRLQLQILYEDGRQELILSDTSWKANEGPIRHSDIYNGECYDARYRFDGWDQTGFDDASWPRVETLPHPEGLHLFAQETEPIRRTEEIRPICRLYTPEGDLVLDFGQNMVGRVRLHLPSGFSDEIILEHAEVLDARGCFYTENLRAAEQRLHYIPQKDAGPTVYEPFATFQGFRYVRIRGCRSFLPLDAITGVVLHSDLEITGQFYCSDPLLNQLQQNILWGQRGNFVDVPTDCPQRDERLGWTGDAQMFATTAAFNMFSLDFFRKWLRDLAADQTEDGGVPYVIPHVLDEKAHSSAAWGDAATIIPWVMYLYYGDRALLAEQYPSMKAWVEFIRDRSPKNLWNSGFHFGDWLGLDAPAGSYKGSTSEDFIATAFYYHSAQLLRRSAEVLGHNSDAKEYSRLQEDIRRAFQKEFVTRTGRLAVPTQTAHVLALMFNLLDEEQIDRTVQWLVDDIKKKDVHLSTGFVGTPYLLFVLSRYGHTDLAYDLLLQTSYPSWLYPVTKGATTIWEHWDGIREDGSFWSPDMNSFNHYAYGAVGDWMYRRVCGLDPLPESPGFQRFLVRPRIGEQLRFAQLDFHSLYGTIQSGWELTEQGTVMNVTIPPNTTASVRIPAPADKISEGDLPLKKIPGVLGVRKAENEVIVDLGSGQYTFQF